MKTGEALGLGVGLAGLALGGVAFAKSRNNPQPPPAPPPRNVTPAYMGNAGPVVRTNAPPPSIAVGEPSGSSLSDFANAADSAVDLFNTGDELFHHLFD